MSNQLCDVLQLTVPVIQAPMAGGPTTPELVAGVCNNGGLGSIGAGYLQSSALCDAIDATRQLTNQAFNVNLFVPGDYVVSDSAMQQACVAINGCISGLDVTVEPRPGPYSVDFAAQIDVLLQKKIKIVSFMFGIPGEAVLAELKKQGVFIMGTATTVDEAVLIADAGFDAIVLQGSEAGGHRGSFLRREEESLVALDMLLAAVRSQVACPLIAAGGIMQGGQVRRYLSLGASATQLGTAFLFCAEAGIVPAYRERLLQQVKDNTVLTRAFSGRLARGIRNPFTRCMAAKTDAIADYPVQNSLTQPMRQAAKGANNADYLSLWAGQQVALGRATTVCELMAALRSSSA
jgi:nitronate monooxygenase